MGVGSKGLHRESVGQAWNRGSTELHWSYAWMEGVRRIQAGQGPRPTGQCTSAIFTNTQTCVEVVTGPQRYTHHNTRPFAHGHSSVYTSSQPPRTRHADNTRPRGLSAWSQMCAHKHYPGTRRHSGCRSQASLQKAQGPGVCKLPKPPASRALCQAKRAPRAAFPSGCLAAQTKRWAEGIRVPAPLAGGGSTTARGKLRQATHIGALQWLSDQ